MKVFVEIFLNSLLPPPHIDMGGFGTVIVLKLSYQLLHQNFGMLKSIIIIVSKFLVYWSWYTEKLVGYSIVMVYYQNIPHPFYPIFKNTIKATLDNSGAKIWYILQCDAGTIRSLRVAPPAHYSIKMQTFSSLALQEVNRYECNIFEVDGYKWSVSNPTCKTLGHSITKLVLLKWLP